MSRSRAFWRLNGCWILFRSILEPNVDIYSAICPWNQFKLILQTRLMQFRKKNTHLLLSLRSSILKLNYLCNWKSLISKIHPCSIPLKLLSNATGLIWFGFFKARLCPFSHNDPILDWFSRANLYDLPHVTVWSFGSKIYRKETTVRVILATLYKIPIWCLEREL